MEQNFYWNRFAKSGSVLDYLYYKETQKKRKQNQKENKKQQIEEM